MHRARNSAKNKRDSSELTTDSLIVNGVVGFPMLVAAHVFLILPLFSSCGVPEYGTTDFDQFLDPVGMALTTAHDVHVRQFGLERLHSCLV